MGILKLRGFVFYGNLPLNVGKIIVEFLNIEKRKVSGNSHRSNQESGINIFAQMYLKGV